MTDAFLKSLRGLVAISLVNLGYFYANLVLSEENLISSSIDPPPALIFYYLKSPQNLFI